jgi:hypothetical protein
MLESTNAYNIFSMVRPNNVGGGVVIGVDKRFVAHDITHKLNLVNFGD